MDYENHTDMVMTHLQLEMFVLQACSPTMLCAVTSSAYHSQSGGEGQAGKVNKHNFTRMCKMEYKCFCPGTAYLNKSWFSTLLGLLPDTVAFLVVAGCTWLSSALLGEYNIKC